MSGLWLKKAEAKGGGVMSQRQREKEEKGEEFVTKKWETMGGLESARAA